jgi:acyl-CoA hydrolase
MEIGVRVEAQPWNGPSAESLHVASGYFVFVATDGEGRPRPVPQLSAEGPDDVRRLREAQIRRAHRLAHRPTRRMEIDQDRDG